jgi:hypothetical protein
LNGISTGAWEKFRLRESERRYEFGVVTSKTDRLSHKADNCSESWNVAPAPAVGYEY